MAGRRRRRPADRADATRAPASGTRWRAAAPSPCAPRSTGTRSSPRVRTAADFTRPDAVVLQAAQRGLGVLPVVHGTPQWAALQPGDPASPPRDPADFSRLLTALVARYGPSGSFWAEHPEVSRQPIRAWQIWNEPNLTRYWNVAPWAPSYVRLLQAADRALKAADPRSQTVLAGLPNESWKAIETIYDAGARGAFDVVTLHPYTGKPANVAPDREHRPARDAPPPRPAAAGLDHRALVARRARQEHPARRLRDDRGRPGAAGSPPACRCSRPRGASCGSSASTGTRGCRSRASPAARSTIPACGGCAATQVHDAPALRGLPAPGTALAGLRETAGRRPPLRWASYASGACVTTGGTARSWPNGRSDACCSPRWPAASRSRCCRSASCCSPPRRPARRRPPASSSPRSRWPARSRRSAGGSSIATGPRRWRPSRSLCSAGIGALVVAATAGAPRGVLVLISALAGLVLPPLGAFTRAVWGLALRERRNVLQRTYGARLRRRGGRAHRRAAARRARCRDRLAGARARRGRRRPAGGHDRRRAQRGSRRAPRSRASARPGERRCRLRCGS